VPGFEFHLTPRPVKKIRHLAMQKSEKRGRISANLQPGRNQDEGVFNRYFIKVASSSGWNPPMVYEHMVK